MPDIVSANEIVGIVNYNNIVLGTHDSYITSEIGIYSTIYTVHCDYINIDDATPFYIIDPAQRRAAEEYLTLLADALNLTSMTSISIGKRQIEAAPAGVEAYNLTNEWTGLVVSDCYCTAITHEDSGGRYYGFTVEFTKPHVDSISGNNAGFAFKNVRLGNMPMGYLETDVSGSFNTYTAVTAYRGEDSGTYIETLANEIGLGTIFKHEVARGSQGNRGIVKSYDVVAGNLDSIEPDTNMPSIVSVFPESIDSSEEATGVLRLTFTFVKAR